MSAVRILVIAPDLSSAASAVDAESLHAVLGKTLETRLKDHFRARPANRRGWASSGFWAQMADATQLDAVDTRGATVTVSDARLRLRYFGGVVRPRSARALAVPLRPEAAVAGSPREIPDLFVLRSRATGRAFLARREGRALRLYFALLPKTTHAPDPTVIPDGPSLTEALTAAATEHIAAALRR